MTVIRMARHGRNKQPFYRIVVQDSRKPRDGRFLENIGYYNPCGEEDVLEIKRDRLEYWLGTGAQMSLAVKNRLKSRMKEWAAAPAAKEA